MQSKAHPRKIHLSKAPLVYSLIQVVYSPVVSIEDHVKKIQEGFRKSGYPGYLRKQIPFVNFITGAVGKVEQGFDYQWEFYNPNKTISIVLQKDSFVLQTTAYTTFTEFSKELNTAWKVINDVIGLEDNLLVRIGMRHIDCFEIKSSQNLKTYLPPSVSGAQLNDVCFPDNEFMANTSITEYSLGDGRSIRLVVHEQPKGGTHMPPDLNNRQILIFPKKHDEKKHNCILDTDCFHIYSDDKGKMVKKEEVMSEADILHNCLNSAFFHIVTDEALEIWK